MLCVVYVQPRCRWACFIAQKSNTITPTNNSVIFMPISPLHQSRLQLMGHLNGPWRREPPHYSGSLKAHSVYVAVLDVLMVTAISGWSRLKRLSADPNHIDRRHQAGWLIKTSQSSVIVHLNDVLRRLCAKTIFSHELMSLSRVASPRAWRWR